MGPSKLAIPLFKVMSLYFSNIHISDTQIGRWLMWIIYILYKCRSFLQAMPPSLAYIMIVQTCGKRWDLPKFVDVLSVNLGFSRLLNMYIYIYTPASSNVCKIIAFSGIIAGDMFFCPRASFVFFCLCTCLPVLKRRKTPTNSEKTRRNGEHKIRTQNAKTETAKKTRNGDILGNRRQ